MKGKEGQPMGKASRQGCAGESTVGPPIEEEIEGGLFLRRPTRNLEQVYL